MENIAVAKKTKFKKVMFSLGSVKELGILVVLLIICFVLAISSPFFLKVENILNVLRQISVVGIIAVGEALIIITGGIDLSVGSMISLGGVATALSIQAGVNPWIALIIGLISGGIIGLGNGLLVVKGRLNAFIVTLGMMNIARGIAYLFTEGMPIDFDNSLGYIGSGYLFGVPFQVIIMFGMIVAGHIFTKKSVSGRYVFAVGDNEKAAKLSGIRVDRIKIFVYTLTGILCALAGVITAGNLSVADTAAGNGIEMDVIAAVVIGGASLSGGQGSIFGVLIGAAIMGVLRNGFVLLGISAYWQMVSIGAVVVLAVYMDQFRKR
jgi:ribose transport system permease protein